MKSSRSRGEGSRYPLHDLKLTPAERKHYHFPNYLVERAFSEPVESSPRPIPLNPILISSNLRLLHVISYCEVSQLKLCMHISCPYCGTGSTDLNFRCFITLMIFIENYKSWRFHFALFTLERNVLLPNVLYNKCFEVEVGNHFRCL
jgi:hypothetical protein